ncbi:hypothetical protein [Streptomyces sp. NPDC006645]|uniref:hypothetical protein n=1 Tax=unclassified Streptomyces TaxID=2593676 RepID=UPI0033A39211
MTRIPDAVAVASLDTHRLIVTVPNEGPADVACNLPRPVAADILRQLANSLESPAGACDTAFATGAPCPLHDAPVPHPAGLDALLAAVADQLPADDPDVAARGLAAMPTPEQRAAETTRPRVLTEGEYDAAYKAARAAVGSYGPVMGSVRIQAAMDAVLALFGILGPRPEPEPDTCDEMFADLAGDWHQCTDAPGHDPAEGHQNGEWSWPHGEIQARPEPDETS